MDNLLFYYINVDSYLCYRWRHLPRLLPSSIPLLTDAAVPGPLLSALVLSQSPTTPIALRIVSRQQICASLQKVSLEKKKHTHTHMQNARFLMNFFFRPYCTYQEPGANGGPGGSGPPGPGIEYQPSPGEYVTYFSGYPPPPPPPPPNPAYLHPPGRPYSER